ncbi:NAD(P)/FAD-dependent oxidoreductase [Acetobacteraceae bacterium]|nr:NAD(P)/FAD-dependent oxidoreductase [Acetobacteraceae bacterium]
MPHTHENPSPSSNFDASKNYDVAIIGAGPSGLFAAFQCGMLGMSSLVIDALSHIGGQCSALYPEKPIYDIPACPGILAEDLVQNLFQQGKDFDISYLLKRKAVFLEGEAGNFTLTTHQGEKIHAKTIMIASGPGAFGPNRPPLAQIEEFEEGGSVHYSVRKASLFTDAFIVIAGGGDSALDWALALAGKAEKIYLVHRRDKFRAHQATLDLVEEKVKLGQIEKITPFQLHRLEGENGKLEKVIVNSLDDEEKALKATHLLAFFGLSSDLKAVQSWGIGAEKNAIPVNPFTMETDLKGVFAIGDVAKRPGKVKLILQGFAEGSLAARGAWQIAHPDEALHLEHSTSLCAPKDKS